MKVRLCGWLCEGLRNVELNERLQATFGLTLSRPVLDEYRAKYRGLVDAAEAEALEDAKRQGYGARSHRVRRLGLHLAKMDAVLEKEAIVRWGQLPKDYLAFLADLRKELGQDAPQKVDISGNLTVKRELAHLSDADLARLLLTTRGDSEAGPEGAGE